MSAFAGWIMPPSRGVGYGHISVCLMRLIVIASNIYVLQAGRVSKVRKLPPEFSNMEPLLEGIKDMYGAKIEIVFVVHYCGP